MTAVDRLAEWAAGVPGGHGAKAEGRAKLAFLDTIGCSLLGAGNDVAGAARQVGGVWGAGGGAQVIGAQDRLAAPWAAMANAAAAHAYDYDDYEDAANSHPSAVLVPALLALGEEEDVDGGALIDAYIVGIEVLMRVGEAVNLSHYTIGWHTTSTIGSIGAAAACGRLLRLDAAAMGHAIGLGVSMASGPQVQFGTMAKPMHAGFAAKAGVLAAKLAAAGVTASPDALDGPAGFLTLQGGPGARGFEAPLAKLGRPLGIDEYGLSVKLHPCCGYTHRSIDGLLALRQAHGLGAEAVERVTARLPSDQLQVLRYKEPSDEMQARFSLPYCLAAALLQGRVTVKDFTPDAIHRPALREAMGRVVVESHPPMPPDATPADWPPDIVTLALADGRQLRREVDRPRGSPEDPVGDGEVAEKFLACAEGVISADASGAAVEAIGRLERLDSLGPLTSLLSPRDCRPALDDHLSLSSRSSLRTAGSLTSRSVKVTPS